MRSTYKSDVQPLPDGRGSLRTWRAATVRERLGWLCHQPYSAFSASSNGERRATAVANDDAAIPAAATRASRMAKEATGA